MIRERLEKLIRERFPGYDSSRSLNQLDSLQLIDFVSVLESEFGITIRGIEVDEKNFGDLIAIEKFILRKSGPKV